MKAIFASAALLAAMPGSSVLAQDSSLTPQDYIDLQQLNARYAVAIDGCSNSGYDYADLYTEDGTFAVSEEWGDTGRVYATGREELAKAAGGGRRDAAIQRPCWATGSITSRWARLSNRDLTAPGAATS